jgi:hypothetical protein
MTTMGIRPGDAVLVIERRGEQQLVYNALAAGFSMDETLAGTHGEPAIIAVFVGTHADGRSRYTLEKGLPTLTVPRVVHISHRDFIEGRAGLGYEELPGPISGVCRYCRCTEQRACPGGCAWLDVESTVCSSPPCFAKFSEDLDRAFSDAVRDVDASQ